MLWNLNALMFACHAGESSMLMLIKPWAWWSALQRLPERTSSGTGTSVHEEHIFIMNFNNMGSSWSRWFVAGKATLKPQPELQMLKFLKRSHSHTLADSKGTVKLLSRETMEREVDVKCLFNAFVLKFLYFVYFSVTHTPKNRGLQRNRSYFQFML